jgi:hypothetical protein
MAVRDQGSAAGTSNSTGACAIQLQNLCEQINGALSAYWAGQ